MREFESVLGAIEGIEHLEYVSSVDLAIRVRCMIYETMMLSR